VVVGIGDSCRAVQIHTGFAAQDDVLNPRDVELSNDLQSPPVTAGARQMSWRRL
jgi:hypothetical protein